jgi:hypothetical protein
MTPAINSIDSAFATNVSALNVPVPPNTGDQVLVCFLTARTNLGGAAITFTPPSGWSLVSAGESANGIFVTSVCFYRVGVESNSSVSWSVNKASDISAVILVIDGADTTTPIDASGKTATSSSNQTANSITTVTNNALLFAYYGIDTYPGNLNVTGSVLGMSQVYARGGGSPTAEIIAQL